MRQDTIVVAPGEVPTTDVLIYEYGVRIDEECLPPIQNQIVLARRLYNDIVASIRMIVEEKNAFVMLHAGADAVALQSRIDALSVPPLGRAFIPSSSAVVSFSRVRAL